MTFPKNQFWTQGYTKCVINGICNQNFHCCWHLQQSSCRDSRLKSLKVDLLTSAILTGAIVLSFFFKRCIQKNSKYLKTTSCFPEETKLCSNMVHPVKWLDFILFCMQSFRVKILEYDRNACVARTYERL